MRASVYKKRLILVETGLGILVLTLACLMLSPLFLAAASGSQASKEKSAACAQMAYLLELSRAAEGNPLQADERQQDSGAYLFHYDAFWQRTKRQDAVYHIEIMQTDLPKTVGTLHRYDALARRSDGSEIARASAARYVAFLKREAA